MNRPFNSKRFWIIVAMLAMVEALVIFLAMQWCYIFPTREVSDLYGRYVGVEGVEVSFVKYLKINDTVFVDATLLEATTDSAWSLLQRDFNILPQGQEFIDTHGQDYIEFWAAPKRDYALPMDTTLLNNDLVAVSWAKHQVGIFSVGSRREMHFLIQYLTHKSTLNNHTLNNQQDEQKN